MAAQYRLRGSDAVYAAVALRFGASLLTVDREQRERVAGVQPAYTPVETTNERVRGILEPFGLDEGCCTWTPKKAPRSGGASGILLSLGSRTLTLHQLACYVLELPS